MFNLTVDEAHTYYVGQDGWLVHNASSTSPNTSYTVNPTGAGLKNIQKHLSNPFFFDAPENHAMMARIEDALKEGRKLTGADANFYMHELNEYTLMRGGNYTDEAYHAAHAATLNKYGHSPFDLYPVDVAKKYGFTNAWIDHWTRCK